MRNHCSAGQCGFTARIQNKYTRNYRVVYFLAEGFNRLHGDSLTTSMGYWGSSVAPIVIFSGKGFKQGVTIDRIIQQVDFAATVAALGGVRMTKGCEGAPVYQAFAEEF